MARRTMLCCLAWLATPAAAFDMDAAYQQGTVGLGHQLRRLATTARVLHLAAHPDDEDTSLLATLARGHGARTVYLSLNRGEGGQNSLGPEQDTALGLLRTEELLAARRLDGAEQAFTSAHDFGFSKSAEETAAIWGREAVLRDVVRAIRRLRPQVIVTRFAGDARDGHGHHQLAGQIAREAFHAAGDADRFPELLRERLLPWQADRLYLDRYRDEGDDAVSILDTGVFDPLYGRTWRHLAGASRSRHRSQDMGMAMALGSHPVRLRLLAASTPTEPTAAILDELALDPATAIPEEPGAPDWQRVAREALADGADRAAAAAALHKLGLSNRRVAEVLAVAVGHFRRANEALTSDGVPFNAQTATWQLVASQKLDEASEALRLALGLELDALADAATLTPGGSLVVAGQAFWPGAEAVGTVRLTLDAPAGWQVEPLDLAPAGGLGEPRATRAFRVTAPADAPVDQPYWLREPRQGGRYADANPALAGRPFQPPPLALRFRGVVAGVVLTLSQPVTHRQVDPIWGERRWQPQVVPPVTASAEPTVLVQRESPAQPSQLRVTLRRHGAAPLDGRLMLLGEAGEPTATVAVSAGQAATATVSLPVPAASGGPRQVAQLAWLATGSAQPQPLWELRTLDYPHIRPSHYLSPAQVTLVQTEVVVPPDLRVGYVPGPAPDILEACRQLGVEPRLLDDAALAAGGWSDLELVAVGARAYEFSAALRQTNPTLLDWVRRGGVLLVQYQKHAYAEGGFAPYPLGLRRPHDRVTNETAPVSLLQPDHPLVSRPNRLGPPDFAGWVQERGLYFAGEFDPAYQPLLACADPGEAAQPGGLLTAEVGRGAYVYCAYALFRQLPAGVPGAYRLLANLLAYPRTRGSAGG